MSRFLKLTNIMVNTNIISKIMIAPNKYTIHIMGKSSDGFMWLICGFGIGTVSSYNSEIEVCETKHSTDYKIVSEWIDKQNDKKSEAT